MPEGGGSNDCHLCHIHDHAPASTLLRTHPLRASQSRSRNPSKSSTTTLNRNLHHHHHHHHDGGHHSRDNGTIRDADTKSMRVASALAKLSERSHSLPGSRGSSISRPNEVSILPNGSPSGHSNRGNDVHSLSRSQREYNNVLSALLDTRVGSLASSHSATHREPDLLNALPRTHNTSRASTLSRGPLHHSNLTLAQDTEQDYYTHINRSRFKDEARKQRFNIQTVMLIGCYTMLFVVAIIVGVVLCQQNGWLGFGHGSSDEVSGNLSNNPNNQGAGTSSMRDLERSTRGRGNRGNWPGPTIDYDYPVDDQPPRINTAGVFPVGQGRGGNKNAPGSRDDPLRTINFQPNGPLDGSNGNQRRPAQRVPSPVVGGDTITRSGQDNDLRGGNSGAQQTNSGNPLGSGKSIANTRDEFLNNNFGGDSQNNGNRNGNRGLSRNNNPFNNFASPGRTGTVSPDAPGRSGLPNFPGNLQRDSNQNRGGNNNGARNSNNPQNGGSSGNNNGVNNRNFNGAPRNEGSRPQGESLGNNNDFPRRPTGNFAQNNGNQRDQPNRGFNTGVDNMRNTQNNNFNTGTGFSETNPSGGFSSSGQDSAIRNLNDGSNFNDNNFNGNININGGRNSNSGSGSDGNGNFPDGAGSNGRGNFNGQLNSDGRRNFNGDGRGNFDTELGGSGGNNFNTGSRGSGNIGSSSSTGGTGNSGASSRGSNNFGNNGGLQGAGNFDTGASSGSSRAGNSDTNLRGTNNFGNNGGFPAAGNFDTGSSNNFDVSSSTGIGNFQSGSGIRGTAVNNGGTSNGANSGSRMRGTSFDNTASRGTGNFESSAAGPVITSSNMGDINSGSGNMGLNSFNNGGNLGNVGSVGNLNSGLSSHGDNSNNGGSSNNFGNFNSGNGNFDVPNMNSGSGTREMTGFINGDGSGGRITSNNFGAHGASGTRENFGTSSNMGAPTSSNTGTTGNFNLGSGGSDHGIFNSNSQANDGSISASGGRNSFNLGNSNMDNMANMNQEQFGTGSGTENFNRNFNGGSETVGSQSTRNGGSAFGTIGNGNLDFGMGLSNTDHINSGSGKLDNSQSSGGSNNNFNIPASFGIDRLPDPIPGTIPEGIRDLGNGDRRRMPHGRNLKLFNLPMNDQSDGMPTKESGRTISSQVIPTINRSQQIKVPHTLNTGTVDPEKIGEVSIPTSPSSSRASAEHNWEGKKSKGNKNTNANPGSSVSLGSQQPASTYETVTGNGAVLFVNGNQNSGQPTPDISVTTNQGIITIPPTDGGSTPLKVMKGFTVQRGEVVAISTIKSSDKDISILQPDHDVIFHITPNAPDAGVSLIRHPNQEPITMPTMAVTSTASPPRSGASPVLRRWEHTDNEGTLSKGLVRKDGSFAFTNCRPSEVCGQNSGSAGS